MNKVRHYKGEIYTILVDKTVTIEDSHSFTVSTESNGVMRAMHTEQNTFVYVYKVGNVYYTHDEEFVIYECEAGNTWARPYEMFWEEVTIHGIKMPRFAVVMDFKDFIKADTVSQNENMFKKEYLCRWVGTEEE